MDMLAPLTYHMTYIRLILLPPNYNIYIYIYVYILYIDIDLNIDIDIIKYTYITSNIYIYIIYIYIITYASYPSNIQRFTTFLPSCSCGCPSSAAAACGGNRCGSPRGPWDPLGGGGKSKNRSSVTFFTFKTPPSKKWCFLVFLILLYFF